MLKNLLLLSWLLFHPVHVTLTSIDFAPKDRLLNVFIKMYLDDFLLDTEQNEEFFLNDKSKSKIVENYINEKFIIRVNNKTVKGKVNNLEVVKALDEDEIRVYMEYKTLRRKPKELLVRNLIMTELYSDQLNFLIIKVDKFEEGFKFTSEITEQVFKIRN